MGYATKDVARSATGEVGQEAAQLADARVVPHSLAKSVYNSKH